MKLLLFLLLSALTLHPAPTSAATSLAETVRLFHPELTQAEIGKALETRISLEGGEAEAFVAPGPKGTRCFVAIRQGEVYLVVDVSQVENGNFGKLGFPRTHYSRYETRPVALRRRGGDYQIDFRTSAWRSGKRYTVTEALIVTAEGEPRWR